MKIDRAESNVRRTQAAIIISKNHKNKNDFDVRLKDFFKISQLYFYLNSLELLSHIGLTHSKTYSIAVATVVFVVAAAVATDFNGLFLKIQCVKLQDTRSIQMMPANVPPITTNDQTDARLISHIGYSYSFAIFS